MKNLLDKLFFRKNNLDDISRSLKELSLKTPVLKVFEVINSFSSSSEIRYVGGCVRKSINKEKIDDIDLATNLEPKEVCEALKKNQIDYYETGIKHGTITALIDGYKFEITSLREDVLTDGRHAHVRYSKDWKKDAARRDFTINSIYSDYDGNLFDPYNGKDDIEKGKINFIGHPDKRIQEDYLRILRYVRFFLNYSKQKHDADTIKSIRVNLHGISQLSKERLIDELKKILNPKILQSLSKDKLSLEIIENIFPELKYFNIFSKLNYCAKKIIDEVDFIFLVSLLIIDETDNADYFLYKFNISKKDQKRIKDLDNFYKNKTINKKLNEKNLNRIFYYKGKKSVIDILNFRIFKSKKLDSDIIELVNSYKNMTIPIMPVKADILMKKYKIPEGKILGEKLKLIEEEWINNNFQISDQKIEIIASS
tara:strand:- start:401 stop:1675 length:1275 start_codon:yes stop_codon:yes gene_type:complete